MHKQIDAALAAATKYEAKNEGDRSTVAFVVALLTDAKAKAAIVNELADSWERQQRVTAAQAELSSAQAGLGPDTQMKP